MKKSFIILSLFSTVSCGSMIRTASGTTVDAAKKQASVEYGCPMDSIKLINKVQHTGHSTYALDVCGTRRVYSVVGSTMQEKK